MKACNQLIFMLLISAALAGCATSPTLAPVVSRDPAPAGVFKPEPEAAARPSLSQPATRMEDALFQALASLDIDYKWGGNTRVTGFDCSGLVAHVFKEAHGISLPRNSAEQSRAGTPVSLENLQVGDLVFFNTQRRPYSHVGIYIGESRFVHAPKPGSVVRTENLKAHYWAKRFDGARRIAVPGGAQTVAATQP